MSQEEDLIPMRCQVCDLAAGAVHFFGRPSDDFVGRLVSACEGLEIEL